jgi:hypothetical protein
MWQISDILSVSLEKLPTSKPYFLNFIFDRMSSLFSKNLLKSAQNKNPQKNQITKLLRTFKRASLTLLLGD